MRQLTTQQKKYLDMLCVKCLDQYNQELFYWDDIGIQHQDRLIQLNDSEILPQEVERYLWDKNFKNLYKRD